ncbi:Protein of unknown function DUF604 [Macleaya cordata]|uniref:Fringe-like n=1 Tax=Macleaya cordata TaxID=56857 RepID=A0A200QYR3_MACCD|nr:Protein of unknown function DUF604 [Macleaya cordata]
MSFCGAKFSAIKQKLTTLCNKLGGDLCRALAIAGLVLYVIYIIVSNPYGQSSEFFSSLIFKNGRNSYTNTKISDIVFGIATSAKTWRDKRPYIEEWWQPNVTRGFVWFDQAPKEYLPWPSYSPPFRVSEDIKKFKEFDEHAMPNVVRLARVILETFREVNKGVKWYVVADDDTVLFVDNLVEVLSKYDHNGYFYIGHNSECVGSNFDHSFSMAFGGAGYALSYPLAKALARNLNQCIMRYPYLFGSDHILQSCISDLGVLITHERGFHQIDLHSDISGFLSAHPRTPFLSLHHLDRVDPIFPLMKRPEALKHLMKAAKVDSSRLLQQSICYHKPNNWTFSISWGYSAQIYEKIHPASIIERPLQTFNPWKSSSRPPTYMFNTRLLTKDPCQAPHFFFFDSIETKTGGNQIITNYIRRWPRKLPTCLSSGKHSADSISKIRVISPAKRLYGVGRRGECCDVVRMFGGVNGFTEVRIRECMEDEMTVA